MISISYTYFLGLNSKRINGERAWKVMNSLILNQHTDRITVITRVLRKSPNKTIPAVGMTGVIGDSRANVMYVCV